MTQFDDNPYADPSAPRRESNPLGIVGFVLSILCLTSPLGFLISLVALTKRPKGFAIAGVIIGLLFSVLLGLLAWGAIAFGSLFTMMFAMMTDLNEMEQEIAAYTQEHKALPASLDDIGWVKQDPWGNDYVYAVNEETGVWTLTILGPDNTLGTPDDIVFDSAMSQSDRSQQISDWFENNAEDIMRNR